MKCLQVGLRASALLIAVLSLAIPQSFAQTVTLDVFVQEWSGRGIDFDGAYGYQCMDLMHQYTVEVLGFDALHASTAYQAYLNGDSRFDKIDNTPTAVPQEGDLVFWNTSVGAAGHVAVFIEGNIDRFSSFDQNWPIGSLSHVQQHDWNGVAGWLHPRTAQPNRLIPYPGGCQSGSDCVPLVLIHGIHGTGVEPGCGMGDPAAGDCNWGPFIRYLRDLRPSLFARFKIYIFRYLSDKGDTTVSIAAGLRDEVDKERLTRFIILAHSMGGLVARAFMERPRPPAGPGYDLLLGTITSATPHHGTPIANKRWRDWKVKSIGDPLTWPFRAALFGLSDRFFWDCLAGSPGLVDESNLPNRSDLLWDDYDQFFAEARAALTDQPSEANVYLFAKRATEAARKLIVYGSSIDLTGRYNDWSELKATIDALVQGGYCIVDRAVPQTKIEGKHIGLDTGAGLMAKLGNLATDGMVPLDSAVFNRNSYVAGRRFLTNYDHQDMLGNPEDDPRSVLNIPLFHMVAQDLNAILRFAGVPPRLIGLSIQPAQPVYGSTARLAFSLKNVNGNTRDLWLKVAPYGGQPCDAVKVAAEPGDRTLIREIRVFPVTQQAKFTLQGEVWPGAGPDPCTTQESPLVDSLTKSLAFDVFAAPVFTQRPTMSLSLADAAKQTFKIGEVVQLTMRTTSGVTSSTGTLPAYYTFLWADTPTGRKFFTEAGDGPLRETATATPLAPPMALIDYSAPLPPIVVSPTLAAGSPTWRWQAAISFSEVFLPGNIIAESAPLSYQMLAERVPEPSVTSIRTTKDSYEVGETMVIRYSTLRGSSSRSYDLLLRITSKASGSDYYFYDNPNDTNRWIHSTMKPMWTGIPVDGDFQIPSANVQPILIEDSTPSGTYTMTGFFANVGTSTPVGGTAQGGFSLTTPTPEGSCFIATAAFGSPMAGSVALLRAFRGRFLVGSALGLRLTRAYYHFAPPVASVIRGNVAARKLARFLLWPAVALATVAMRFNVLVAVFVFTLLTAALVVVLYKASNRLRLLILLIALASLAAAAEVQGTVVKSRPFPAPVPGMRVELVGKSLSAVTDRFGGFRFNNLAAGVYTVKASGAGYAASSVDVTLTAATSVARTVVPVTPIADRLYEYYLPHTAEGPGWWTFFSILNPNFTAADVTMAAYGDKGEYLGTSETISRLNINQQITGAPSRYFPASVIQKAAWYRLTSTAPLTGFEMFGADAGTLAAFPITTASATQIYLPHVASDNQWWTGVSFLSTGLQSSQFHLEALDAGGAILTEGTRLNLLGPGEKTVDVIENYFGWDFPTDIQWLRVRSDGPITGFELFGTRDFKMLAAVPALTRGWKRFYFPHVTTTSGWWTGIAMVNVDTKAANLRLTAYGVDGTALAVSRPLSLLPAEKSVGVIESYFDNWNSGTRYVEATSDADVTGFELPARFVPPLFGGLPAMAAEGSQLAFSYAISTVDWETSLGIVNTSGTQAQVVLQAMDNNGKKLKEAQVKLAAKGYRLDTLKSLFGTVPSGTSWVKADTGGPSILGFMKLARVKTEEFADIPAEPLVPANRVGEPPDVRYARATSIAAAAAGVKFEFVSGGGVRLAWSKESDPMIRALTDGQLQVGDVVLSIEGFPLNTGSDLWEAYRRFKDAPEVTVVIRRPATDNRTIRLSNPLLQNR